MSTFKEKIDDVLSVVGQDKVVTLILDDSKNSNVADIPPFANLKTLSIVNCGLSSLAGFPALGALKKLDASDNKIADGLEHLRGAVSRSLKQLLLSGNRIKSLDQLAVLAEFEALELLELISCDVNQTENYRDAVFALLPRLVYLDGVDRNGVEYEYSDYDEDEDEDGEEGKEDEEGDDEDDDAEEEEEGLSMADLLKADQSNEFLDDEEPYVPNEIEAESEDESDELSENEGEAGPEALLSPAGVSAAKRCPKRKIDNGDVDSTSPCKKTTN